MTDSFRLLLRRSCMAAAFADRIPIILRDFHASIKRVCVESERFMHVVPSHASCVPVLTRDILRASWMQPLQNRLPCFKIQMIVLCSSTRLYDIVKCELLHLYSLLCHLKLLVCYYLEAGSA